MKHFLLFFIISNLFANTHAQNLTAYQYIQQHKELAIREMKRMGIPAAITLAQGLLETENGNSDLVKKSNNHFGIKCKSSWTAEGISHDDDAPGECFRSYKDAEASYRDHSNYLRGNDRYGFLFKLDPRDYKSWAYGLKKAGYATNPRYPDILIKNIEDNNLQQYTLLAVNDVPKFDASKYTSDPEEKAIEKITKSSPSEPFTADVNISVNGIKGVFAHKGRSLLAIATNNNINLAKLLEYNDLQQDGLLEKDQNIFLEKKGKEGDKEYYILQEGETLYDAAQINGVRLQNVNEYNSLKSASPVAGQKVFLRNRQHEPDGIVALNNNNYNSKLAGYKSDLPSGDKKTHIVQPKEGLYSISKKYGITIPQLKEWNNLSTDNLQVGQELIISK